MNIRSHGVVFIFLLQLLYSLGVSAMDCDRKVKISYLENREEKQFEKRVCVFKNMRSFISFECQKKCEARMTKRNGLKVTPGMGSPSHHECRDFNGKPLIATVSLSKETFQTVVCQFRDGSLLTTDLLGNSDAL